MRWAITLITRRLASGSTDEHQVSGPHVTRLYVSGHFRVGLCVELRLPPPKQRSSEDESPHKRRCGHSNLQYAQNYQTEVKHFVDIWCATRGDHIEACRIKSLWKFSFVMMHTGQLCQNTWRGVVFFNNYCPYILYEGCPVFGFCYHCANQKFIHFITYCA